MDNVVKQICIDNDIGYEKFKSYKRLHPELSNEEILNYYLEKRKPVVIFGKEYSSIKSWCNINGINYSSFLEYKRRHPNLSTNDIIEYYYKQYLSKNEIEHRVDEQTINYKKVILTKDDIIPIRDKFQSHVPDRCFESKNLETITSDISEQIKQAIHQYELKYKENLEMLGICELALLYLEEHKND